MSDPAQIILIGYIGLCFGSFASLLAYRLPRGLPWAATRSQCPACGHVLGAWDLIPLVSWMVSGGKCRYCKEPVPIRYPLLEIISAVICLALYALIGWQWVLAPMLISVPFAMAFVMMRFSSAHD